MPISKQPRRSNAIPVRDTAVTYTNDGRLMNVFNYPPGSFLILAPLYVLGDIDPRWLYGLAFFFIAAMLLWRAPPSLRPLALGFLGFHQFFALWAVPGGVAEPLWMALLLVAWLLRDRPVLGGAVLGLRAGGEAIRLVLLPLLPHHRVSGSAACGRLCRQGPLAQPSSC